MKRLYSTKRNRPTNKKRSKGLARQKFFMLKNIKISGTKPKLLAFSCVLLPWPSLSCFAVFMCTKLLHCGSSLLTKMLYKKKYSTAFTASKRFTTLRSPGAQSFHCGRFLFTKIQQGLTTMKQRCVFIYHGFLQVSLFVDVYKKQATHRLRTIALGAIFLEI